MYNIEEILEICDDVINRASPYMDELETKYLIIEEDCVSNAKDKFLLSFYSIKAILLKHQYIEDELLIHLVASSTYCDIDYILKRPNISSNYNILHKEESDDKRWMVFDRNTKAVSRRIYSGDKILDEIMSLVIEGTNNILKKLKITSDADILSWVNSAIKSKEIACDKDNMGELKYIRKVFEQRLRDSGYDN